MTALPAVSVVFAACNHADTLRAVLDALDATDWPDLEIVAVDCGSTDGGLRQLRERAARPGGVPFRLLELPGAGRATALNAGFAAAGSRDVVRLHADVVPDGAGWLRSLHAVCAARSDCGVVGAKIVMAGGRIQSCGRNLINGLGIVPEWSDRRWLEADRDDASNPTEVDGVSGELQFVRRVVLDATGGLDPGYDPVFGDDDDFCLLARWHGFSVYVEPAARGVHHAPRQSTTTSQAVADPTGLLQRSLDDRAMLQGAHRDHFRTKWGFDPCAPDLHEVRRRYGHTKICWRIGDRLTETLPEQPEVDVCLVTWNSMAVLPRAMEALAATRWPKVHVWITDNGSRDGTLAYLEGLRATFPFPLHVETLPQNFGVAQALNVAFARGTAPLVARLDDDTIVSPEWLDGLIPRFRQRPYAGMVGPKVLHDNGGQTLQSGPSREFPGHFPGIGPGDRDLVDGLCRVVTIRGCCNVYRRSVFAEIGLLDVRFSPSQFDEWDHHITMVVAGYETIYDGSVTVRHLLTAGRMATPGSFANFRANFQKSNAKWGGRHWQALDRAIDLSIDGRFLPPDGDTSALRAKLPPVPEGPPARPWRDPEEIAARTAIARRRSLLRSLSGPLRDWWQSQLDLGEEALAERRPQINSVVTKVMDLLPHDPQALLLVARFRAVDGDHVAAATTAKWALRLRPDDASLQELAAPLFGAVAPVPAAPRGPAPRVLLLPTMERGADEARRAAELAADALRARGVPCEIETRLVPEPRGAAVVHAFGLGDAAALVGRLQVLHTLVPRPRIVLSSLLADPGPANWSGHVVGSRFFAADDELRQLLHLASLGQVVVNGTTERNVPGEPYEDAALYERRCLAFVDELVVHGAPELAFLRARHPSLPRTHRLAEGTPEPAALVDDPEVPHGGVLAVGPRDLPGHHLPMVLALRGSGLPLTLCGRVSHPYGEWRTQQRADELLHWLPDRRGEPLTRAFRRSAVFLWLPSAPSSFALPLQAAAAGCELVLARGIGAEALFGDSATWVDPCDLPAVRAAVLAARARWRDDPDEPWRTDLRAAHSLAAYGDRLLAVYGLGAPAFPPRRPHELQPA